MPKMPVSLSRCAPDPELAKNELLSFLVGLVQYLAKKIWLFLSKKFLGDFFRKNPFSAILRLKKSSDGH